MKPEQEDFDQLRRLLKLKRYEQPPPRYFSGFSSQIVARIRAGEAGGREASFDSESWLVRLWALIEAKPMLPGAVGVAFCALLVFGAVYTETTTSALGPEFIQSQPAATAHDPIFALNQSSSPIPTAFTNANVVIGVGNSLFDQIPLPPAELISRPFSK